MKNKKATISKPKTDYERLAEESRKTARTAIWVAILSVLNLVSAIIRAIIL